MVSDFRSAARGLLRTPTVAVAGVLCLAFGIGATAVISSAIIGSLGGVGLTRFITFALYGVSPLDVTTWIASLVLMFVAGLLATLVPAHRATRVNPVIAIQAE